MQTRISDVTSQSNAFKRERDTKQAHINAMNLRTNDNHRKYLEVQNTARMLHGQLQTTRRELAQARHASQGSTNTLDAMASCIPCAARALLARACIPEWEGQAGT